MMEPARLAGRREIAGFVAGAAAMAVLWFAPLSIPKDAQHTFAILAMMMIFWATEVTSHAITGLIGCYLFWALGVTPLATAFGGFVTATPWFILTALLLGSLALSSGLARRLAYLILSKTGDSYPAILFSLIFLTLFFNLIVPSALARVAVLAVVGLGLVEAFGAGSESNIGRGLFLAIAYLNVVWDKLMLSGAGSLLARGLTEQATGVKIYWAGWFLAFLPADILLLGVSWLALLWLFPAQQRLAAGSDSLRQKLQELGVWSQAEKKAGIILGLLLALWMTDALHHVAPEVVCIGVCFACFLPGIAALTGDDLKKLNMAPVLFTGAALSLGAVMSKTKANEVLARYMFAWLEPWLHNHFLTVVGLYWSCFIYHGFMPNAQSLLSTTLPPLLHFASKNGMNAAPVSMLWTAASGPSIFLFQSGVIVLAHSYGQFRAKDFLKYGLLMAAIEFVVLTALVLLVWPFIGLALRN